MPHGRPTTACWSQSASGATRTRPTGRPLDHELRAIDAHRPVIEHAKGALMLRYGIDSYQAFAVLVSWARETHTPVHTVAAHAGARHLRGQPADRGAPGSADALDGVPAPAQRPRPAGAPAPSSLAHAPSGCTARAGLLGVCRVRTSSSATRCSRTLRRWETRRRTANACAGVRSNRSIRIPSARPMTVRLSIARLEVLDVLRRGQRDGHVGGERVAVVEVVLVERVGGPGVEVHRAEGVLGGEEPEAHDADAPRPPLRRAVPTGASGGHVARSRLHTVSWVRSAS